jgi:hypothetical protein
MRWSVVMLILIFAPGCTSVALKKATLSHAGSSTDLRYVEAIENLAMSASNPHVLPAYSSIFAGTTDINDSIKGSSVSVWVRNALQHPLRYVQFFSTQNAEFIGSRAVKSNWTLDPTVVPEKLRAMRAACWWVTQGAENVGPDIDYLLAYEPAEYDDRRIANLSLDSDPPVYGRQLRKAPLHSGYYFDVVARLRELPDGWLHIENRRCTVPRNACYWSSSGDKFVWVGPEGMAAFSEFVLVLQKIARTEISSAYFPKTQTRKIQTNFTFDEDVGGENKTFLADATYFLDENGILTTGENAPAIPVKKRRDNVGTNSDLRSVINASAKSSAP